MKENKIVTVHVGNGSPMVTQYFNRNSLCRCGSGKKTKRCCGAVIKYYHSKAINRTAKLNEDNTKNSNQVEDHLN